MFFLAESKSELGQSSSLFR